MDMGLKKLLIVLFLFTRIHKQISKRREQIEF